MHPHSPLGGANVYMFYSCFFLFFVFLFFSVRQKIWDNRSRERLNGFSWNFYETIGGKCSLHRYTQMGARPPKNWFIFYDCLLRMFGCILHIEVLDDLCQFQQIMEEKPPASMQGLQPEKVDVAPATSEDSFWQHTILVGFDNDDHRHNNRRHYLVKFVHRCRQFSDFLKVRR